MAQYHWYDATRDDPVFVALLGEYNDDTLLELPEEVELPVLANPTALSTAALNAASAISSDNYKGKLQLFCERMYHSPPTYTLSKQDGPPHAPTFESMVVHEANESLIGTGVGSTKKESEMAAAFAALEKLQRESSSEEQAILAQKTRLELSFRAAASALPFPLRFQLERSILMKDAPDRLRIKKRPQSPAEYEGIKSTVEIGARKLILVYMQIVLPPLLAISWDKWGRTIQELFADEIWESLCQVKLAMDKGKGFEFWEEAVESALQRAAKSLAKAEDFVDAKEDDLDYGDNNDFDIIQKRSMWPTAEYRCKIVVDTEYRGSPPKLQFRSARLVPSEYEMNNKNLTKNARVVPNSRRALREEGWRVRDCFVLVSSVKFDRLYNTELAPWLAREPELCGRKYSYLFDKGIGKPNVWLYCESFLSRDEFLGSLGCFEGIVETKVGDRIGLAFTHTKPVDILSMGRIIAIEEIIRNNYIFSDGCGVMGIDIARKAQAVFKLSKVPGAIQIRMGGVKGMLSLVRGFPADCIGLRPSMVKFRSSHMILEVKEIAIAKNSTDNKIFNQALLVMHYLNVPPRPFLDLQAVACAEMASEFDDGLDRLKAQCDMTRTHDYVNMVTLEGKKLNGDRFSPEELVALKKAMTKAKTRVSLQSHITLMKAVVDEHGILDEGEVLVGNGAVQGSVLICRSPCNMPGDIQRAYAVQGQLEKEPPYVFKYLQDVLVLSARGARPLADMLAGGDCDGDEYFIMHEQRIFGQLSPASPHDFGSRLEGPIPDSKRFIDVSRVFSPSACTAPLKENQLQVFGSMMALGDIVSRSSEAWTRVADQLGPSSPEATRMAILCQRALDSRKHAAQISRSDRQEMESILAAFKAPDWGTGGKETRVSHTILGIMYRKWLDWISLLDKALKKHHPGVQMISSENELTGDAEELVSLPDLDGPVCAICLGRAGHQCELCPYVWYCSDACKRTHGIRAGHVRLENPMDGGGSNLEDIDGNTFESIDDATSRLIEVVFGRKRAVISADETIDFKVLDHAALNKLSNLVCIEFFRSLSDSIKDDSRKGSKDIPRPYDVFLLKSSFYKQGGELAVCRPAGGRSRDLFMQDKNHNFVPLGETSYVRRVASLSGTVRILESLMSRPAPGDFMHQVMQRENLVEVAEDSDKEIPLSVFNGLNESQRKVVQTVAAPGFESGLLFVQGPPGTGKSHTIVGILQCLEQGVIVTAPSNAAVANLALMLLNTNQFSITDIVVWGENCDDSVKFLNPEIRNARFKGFIQGYSKAEIESEKSRRRTEFASFLHQNSETTSVEDIAKLCKFDRDKPLSHARFIFCTLNTAGSGLLRKAIAGKVDLLILDEAGQCPEAESYIATTIPGVHRAVFVGDPKQLSATVVDQGCRDAGYDQSLLEHVLRYHPHKVHLLDTQYRMDPDILMFPNATFYGGRIISGDNVHDCRAHYQIQSAALFVDVAGMSAEEQDPPSWKNEYEAATIKHILFNDDDIVRLLERSPDSRVIIISPYTAQVRFLKKVLKTYMSKGRKLDIATVDSFQGQEGDVVIVSTVRTSKSAQFLDANRMNVAVTRAKMVLRVVGDIKFFCSLPAGSALQLLGKFMQQKNFVRRSELRADWSLPDWSIVTSWQPTMTSRFHNCLQGMAKIERNVAFNTLLSIAKPDFKAMSEFPVGQAPRWQKSSLRKQKNTAVVVWVAKEHEQAVGTDQCYVGTIEAHFVGSRQDALQFMQVTSLPRKVRGVVCDISRSAMRLVAGDGEDPPQATDLDLSWLVTNELQNAVIDETIESLPEGLFILDPDQRRVVNRPPPLLLESRSGTGKTNCLFCHAFAYAQSPFDTKKPICFITVSPRLCTELRRRYDEAQKLLTEGKLHPVHFYTLSDLLTRLLRTYSITDMAVTDLYSFLEYVNEGRSSNQRIPVDVSLANNEIGGVIEGSLACALTCKPLTREAYLMEKRSNVPNKTDEGRNTRYNIYDEYEKYEAFKTKHRKVDIHDLVLRLIKDGSQDEIFQSVYVDEVQDFSYACLFLICKIAGRGGGRWAAAGDTAQMISAGCSFTFDGMKQTMRALNENVELRKVEQLTRNYRLSKGVLDVGNAILKELKCHFPHAIEYAPPESAEKDLGFRVALLDWDKAVKERVSLGVRQAVIYATPEKDVTNIEDSLSRWTRKHPFILSALESKGLEFDDVVIHAFDYPHKAWNPRSECFLSLCMLRELYVATTRGRQRVVILTSKRNKSMFEFFLNRLDCNIEEVRDPKAILVEFDKVTTPEMWFSRGMELFDEEKFSVAVGCFNAAGSFGWSSRARAHYHLSTGGKQDAKTFFRTSAKLFYEMSDYRGCLDSMNDLAGIPPWDEKDDAMLDRALKQEPNYLPRAKTVKFAIVRGAWHSIYPTDLIDHSTSDLFLSYREKPVLKEIAQKSTPEELRAMETKLPSIVGDVYLERQEYLDALRLFLAGKDLGCAVEASEGAIAKIKLAGPDCFPQDAVLRLVNLWLDPCDISVSQRQRLARERFSSSETNLLITLFEQPQAQAASRNNANRCMEAFGRGIVLFAVRNAGGGAEELHSFDRDEFREDIIGDLEERYQDDRLGVVTWYTSRQNVNHAIDFVFRYLNDFSDGDMLSTNIRDLFSDSQGCHLLINELERRELLVSAAQIALKSETWNLKFAEEVTNRALNSVDAATQNFGDFRTAWNARQNDAPIKRLRRSSDGTPSITILMLHLLHDPEYAGSQFGPLCFEKFGADIIRTEVGMDSPQILRLFDESLAPAPAPAPPNVEREFDQNNRVIIHGLVRASHHNGKHGKVQKRLDNGRYAVRIDGGNSNVAIRAENLTLESDDDDNDSMPPLEPRARNSGAQDYPSSSDSSISEDDSEPAPLNHFSARFRPENDNSSSSSDGSDDIPDLLPNRGGQAQQGNNSDNESVPGLVDNGPSSSDDSSMPPDLAQHDDSSDNDSSDMPDLVGRVGDNQGSDSSTASDSSSDSFDNRPPRQMPPQRFPREQPAQQPNRARRRQAGRGGGRRKRGKGGRR